MLVKRLVLLTAAAAVILGAGAVVLDGLAGSPVPLNAGDTVTPASEGESASPSEADGVPGTAGTESPEPEAGSGGGSAESTRSTEAGDRPALEVLPPVVASPTGLPMPSPHTALVSAPLPESASSTGDIVEGFPSHVLVFPDTTVTVFTGVSSSGNTLQATAEGIADLSPDKVKGHFQQVLLTVGFQTEDPPTSAGQDVLRLTRGLDSVSISISTTGTGSTRFSLLGNFHTEPGL